jgi:hypothetical protein
MRRPGSSIQALSRFASSLLHFPRHHLCPYCPSVEKGWCVHATQTSQETTAKRKGSNSAGANVPTSRTSRSNQTRVRAARFGSNQHRCMLQQLHRGTPDESRQPLPSQQTRPKRSLALSNPRSTAAGPFLTTPASSLFDPCSHKIVSNTSLSPPRDWFELAIAGPTSFGFLVAKEKERPGFLFAHDTFMSQNNQPPLFVSYLFSSARLE